MARWWMIGGTMYFLQVVAFPRMALWDGRIHPFPYITWILQMPISWNKSLQLWVAGFYGLGMDILTAPLGVNALLLPFFTALRWYWLKALFPFRSDWQDFHLAQLEPVAQYLYWMPLTALFAFLYTLLVQNTELPFSLLYAVGNVLYTLVWAVPVWYLGK
ncbi:MAG: hypothetical protein ACUVRD_05050 [Bacteroidia bacterium]